VEEILAEGALSDELDEVTAGGGDDPRVDRAGLVAARALELVRLEETDQLLLGGRCEGADLVEEDGPAVGALEEALAARGCLKVNLQVRASNAGVVAFYERLGYAVEERVSMGKRLY